MTPTASPSTWQARNARLLAAYARERSIDNRNAIVRANLALVWQAARRESQRTGHCFDDLNQVGCLGLIRAVEAFDPSRGASLSSAAMPWIVGQMRQHLRDRCQPLHGSRSLHELNQRARSLQQQHLQAPLTDQQMAQALGCSLERWQEARQLQQALRLASLEQPLQQEDGTSHCLADQIADPNGREPYAAVIRSEQRRRLWQALRTLERSQRRLLLGRVLQQRAWSDLGRQLGLSGRVAQRRFTAVLELLRSRLGAELSVEGLAG